MPALVPFNFTGASDIEEVEDSPTVTYERGQASGQRKFKCLWDNRYVYRNLILPSPDMSGQFVNIPPAFAFPGDNNLIANKVSISPFGKPLGDGAFPPNWSYAKLVVDYKTEDYFQTTTNFQPSGPGGASGSTGQGNRIAFISHEVTISGDFLSWPSSALQAGANADPSSSATGGAQRKIPEDQHSAIILPHLEHKITWHYVPYPPWAAMRWLVGNVNAYWFAGAPPETLLFLGCEAKREMPSSGTQLYTLTYKFSEKNMNQLDPYRAFGWNHYLRVNGYNAGSFQIVDRKTPSGYTSLTETINNGDLELTVASRTSFPAAVLPGMYLKIENEIIKPSSLATNTWALTSRGQFGTTDITHDDTTAVQSVIIGTLAANIAANQQAIELTDGTIFPQVGQFFLTVDNEVMVVSRRFSGNANNFFVLRGVRGTTAASHNFLNTPVFLANSPMYPLGDFKYLFMSGLQFS